MEITIERRHDVELRAVINQALELKEILGQSAAVSFLVEQYVSSPLLHQVLMRTAQPSSDVVAGQANYERHQQRTGEDPGDYRTGT